MGFAAFDHGEEPLTIPGQRAQHLQHFQLLAGKGQCAGSDLHAPLRNVTGARPYRTLSFAQSFAGAHKSESHQLNPTGDMRSY